MAATTRWVSYSPAAAAGFRRWLAERHGSIEALNEAWGTGLLGRWSTAPLRGRSTPPNLTVTEARPGRTFLELPGGYLSDAVVAF